MDNKELTKQEKKELMQKLLLLYQHQTQEEQYAGVTVEKEQCWLQWCGRWLLLQSCRTGSVWQISEPKAV